MPELNCYGNPEYAGDLAAEIMERFVRMSLVCGFLEHRHFPSALHDYAVLSSLPLANLPRRIVMHVFPYDLPRMVDRLERSPPSHKDSPAKKRSSHIARILRHLLTMPRIWRRRVDLVIATCGLRRIKLQLQAIISMAFTLKRYHFDIRIRSILEKGRPDGGDRLFVHDFTPLLKGSEEQTNLVLERW